MNIHISPLIGKTQNVNFSSFLAKSKALKDNILQGEVVQEVKYLIFYANSKGATLCSCIQPM